MLFVSPWTDLPPSVADGQFNVSHKYTWATFVYQILDEVPYSVYDNLQLSVLCNFHMHLGVLKEILNAKKLLIYGWMA